MGKLVSVLAEYATEQVKAGADVIQVFDSWVDASALRTMALCAALDGRIGEAGSNFGCTGDLFRNGYDRAVAVDEAETGAEVIGVDWRVPIDEGWRSIGMKARCRGTLIRCCCLPVGRN